MGNYEKALEFLKQKYSESEYFKRKPWSMEYRINHSIRTANIGRYIAKCEGMNEEALAIGCLLHDISYALDFNSKEDIINHGRTSAKMVRPFLKELGYTEELINNICYGIAIHVDDKADFEGTLNPFSYSIVASDNIDRYDTYRIYDNMEHVHFDKISIEEQLQYVNKMLKQLKKAKLVNFMTKTANDLWQDKIAFQIKYFNRLLKQLQNSF